MGRLELGDAASCGREAVPQPAGGPDLPSVLFPSVAWFQILGDLASGDPSLHRLGVVQLRLGLGVGEDRFLMEFGYHPEVVAGVWRGEPRPDCWLMSSLEVWREMIGRLRAAGRSVSGGVQSLLPGGPMLPGDSLGPKERELLVRIGPSLARFFGYSAFLPTHFDIPTSPGSTRWLPQQRNLATAGGAR